VDWEGGDEDMWKKNLKAEIRKAERKMGVSRQKSEIGG
jgi:hypothetical protein